MKHIIIGTAGHIDHGKTTLIKALTGRETDTLREEKERGISINLGFTYFDLPSGKRAGIVDVPGHEKFIKNMLAGVSGIDMVLLVIAADEGVMPQTREHLNIISLLDVKKGIVVITKKDMVDGEWLDVVKEDVVNYLKGTILEGAPIISVSSVTGEGLDELVKQIDLLSETVAEKNVHDCFRLPVDRAFTVSGFGTVVTGTLVSGTVTEGQRVEIYPSGIECKVRGIQVHESPVKDAYAGQRVAVNLSNVKVEEVKRGDTVAEKGCMEPSMMIDCRLNYLKDAPRPLENRDRVKLYHGTSELLGRVVLLDRDTVNQGETCLVQIRLEEPISARKGDKFVIRTYSPMITIGGGTIIDSNPPKRKRFDTHNIEELVMAEKGSPEEVVEQVILKNSGSFPTAAVISKLSGIKTDGVQEIISMLQHEEKVISFITSEGLCYVHMKYMDGLFGKMEQYLKQFHEKNPLKPGMAKEEIKSRLFEGSVKQKLFDDILSFLEDKKLVKTTARYVALYGYEIKLTPEQEKMKEKILGDYEKLGVGAGKLEDIMAPAGVNEVSKMVYGLLLDSGELVKINDDMVISRKSFDDALKLLKNTLIQNGEITLAQYRDNLQTSRKYAVSLLEYFDQNKITKRVGDKRILY